ncbi:unnamed protein product, partial [Prorocentrum cordatum]
FRLALQKARCRRPGASPGARRARRCGENARAPAGPPPSRGGGPRRARRPEEQGGRLSREARARGCAGTGGSESEAGPEGEGEEGDEEEEEGGGCGPGRLGLCAASCATARGLTRRPSAWAPEVLLRDVSQAVLVGSWHTN